MNYLDTIISVLQRWYKALMLATPKIAVGIIVFTLFVLFSTYLSKISVKVFHHFFPKSKNKSVVALIKFFKFLITLGGAFIALEIMGLGDFVFKFVGSLGVAGIVAGVALKDLVSSMFSGALVGLDKSFEDGDYVMIKDTSGVVEKIGFLTTKIITDDGKKVFVPNQLIFSAPFTNFSASGQRKVFLDLQIPSTQDLEKATEIIKDEIQDLDFSAHPEETQVIVLKQALGVFHLQARFFVKKGKTITQAKSEALVLLKKKLDEANIELAS